MRPTVVYITRAELRQRFNELRVDERIRRGEVSTRVLVSSPAPPGLPFPEGTQSQRIAFIDATGRQFAVAHQYRKPDGTLAGSGRPDPKELLVDDMLYKADPNER